MTLAEGDIVKARLWESLSIDDYYSTLLAYVTYKKNLDEESRKMEERMRDRQGKR